MSDDEYTPTTGDARKGYAYSRILHAYYDGGDEEYAAGLYEFDRWLATVKAEAWDEGWRSRWDNAVIVRHTDNPYRDVI